MSLDAIIYSPNTQWAATYSGGLTDPSGEHAARWGKLAMAGLVQQIIEIVFEVGKRVCRALFTCQNAVDGAEE